MALGEPTPLHPPEPHLVPVEVAPLCVYAVQVEGRLDGLFVFRERANAERFRDAVFTGGGEAVLSEEPLCDDSTADLIRAETDRT